MKNRFHAAFFFFDCSGEYINMRNTLISSDIWAESFSWMHGTEKEPVKKLSQRISSALGEGRRVVIIFRLEANEPSLKAFFLNIKEKTLLIPIGSEAVALRAHTIKGADVEIINRYFINGGKNNIERAAAYIMKYILGENNIKEPLPPTEKPFDGIFSTASDTTWPSLKEYLAETGDKYPCRIGWLIHRNSWNAEDFAAVATAEKAFASRGIGVIPVFSNANHNCLSFAELTERYFSINGKLAIDALINGQIFSVRAEEGRTLFEQAVLEYKKLDIPIINPIHSFYLTEHEWRQSAAPLSMDMPSAYITPEATGVTESIIISARSEEGTQSAVMPEMVEYLCARTAKWVALRRKKNCEKKLVFMLHNSPCSGVEATIGKAYGLDAFESACRLARALHMEGYETGEFPECSEELFAAILEKKAFSDFRWTAVEDIIEHGGCIYRMNVDEYMKYYRALPEELRNSMEKTWGLPPGEGMSVGNDIIITGVVFGNITVMIQPKRGCYGAKCTGEVCRILHDPQCPPPHQYLAVYRYAEHILCADAYVEIGTDGSLEYLPGKSNAPSMLCWTYAVLGTLPLIYIYNAGVPSEAALAKRRINALTVGHLPPARGGAGKTAASLAAKIDEFFKAKELGNGQDEDLLKEINILLHKIPEAERLIQKTTDITEGLRLTAEALKTCFSDRNITERHILGTPPNKAGIIRYIKEVWLSERNGETYGNEETYAEESAIETEIEAGLDGGAGISGEDARKLRCGLLACGREIVSVVHALNGGYVEPGESGMPDRNGRSILPTGGNLHTSDTSKIPTKTAYRHGFKMAEELIAAYLRDEGRLPRKAAINMTSLDITMTNGEQLSQFLALLGIRPIWDNNETFRGLEAIPIKELGRPRIDVTVRITGVLRDTWPFAVKIMDDAVMLAASLDESSDENYLIGNMQDFIAEIPETEAENAAVRIFGDAPGAYGAGVDLALMASAWDSDKDLAEYFIQASAYAYGNKLHGRRCVREFVDNIKRVDLSADAVTRGQSDAISSGFSIQVHGGVRLAVQLLGGKNIRQYQIRSNNRQEIQTLPLNASIEEDIRATLLNPFWRECRKQEGRDGASDFMHAIQNIFAAQCTCAPLDDKLIDDVAEACINDKEIREWMISENKFASEEIARRLLELYSRGKWSPDAEVLSRLEKSYLSIEGEMEGSTESAGEIQGGAVEKINHTKVETWRANLADIEKIIKETTAHLSPKKL